MPTVMVAAALAIFAYVAGNAVYAKYLFVPYIPGAGELCILPRRDGRGGLGFLWFNAYPAEVFMGDVGRWRSAPRSAPSPSSSARKSCSFDHGRRLRRRDAVGDAPGQLFQIHRFGEGKRIFRMAPLHHHFEQTGWKETQVVVRFWIITIMLVLFGLSTLKLRGKWNVKGKLALVLGLGESGLAMATWLRARAPRARRRQPRHAAERRCPASASRQMPNWCRAVCCSELCRHRFHRHLALAGPGKPMIGGAVGVPVVVRDRALCRRRRARSPVAKIVAITGSNGKTTTTALTAHLANAAGVPAGVAATSRHRRWMP